jgi:hypothetical protein
MAFDCSFIRAIGGWWLLMAIGTYFINGYWWLF